MNQKKNYEELTIRDHYMFGKVCSDKENAQIILNALLASHINIVSTDIEKRLQNNNEQKCSYLDLLALDDEGAYYDGELQHKSKNPMRQTELPKRSRYYQSVLDGAILDSGKEYNQLSKTYIIFICTFDLFGKGAYKYEISKMCAEYPDLTYDDETRLIFFNTTASMENVPPEVANMLRYIESGVAADDNTRKIDTAVKDARLNEEWRSEYMLQHIHDYDMYQEGLYDGEEKIKVELEAEKARAASIAMKLDEEKRRAEAAEARIKELEALLETR